MQNTVMNWERPSWERPRAAGIIIVAGSDFAGKAEKLF